MLRTDGGANVATGTPSAAIGSEADAVAWLNSEIAPTGMVVAVDDANVYNGRYSFDVNTAKSYELVIEDGFDDGAGGVIWSGTTFGFRYQAGAAEGEETFDGPAMGASPDLFTFASSWQNGSVVGKPPVAI